MSLRETQISLRYDPDADAATLRLAPGPGRVGANVYVAPPGSATAAAAGPDDTSTKLRLRFDDEGRLHAIEFLMPDEQLPAEVMARLRAEGA